MLPNSEPLATTACNARSSVEVDDSCGFLPSEEPLEVSVVAKESWWMLGKHSCDGVGRVQLFGRLGDRVVLPAEDSLVQKFQDFKENLRSMRRRYLSRAEKSILENI